VILTVASGKGGTGKTTIACALALALAEQTPLLLDCDVEEPNAHIFMKPEFEEKIGVGIATPRVDEARCTACGRCGEVCQYHAIVAVGRKVMVFPELCHGCGSCTLQCPEEAISEFSRTVGVLESGMAQGGLPFARGVLNVGEPMASPLIRRLKRWSAEHDRGLIIRDAPPGTACPVVETMRGSDFVLLVTEPTPFGLHDLRLAVEVARQLGLPAAVLVNRDGVGDQGVDCYCEEEGLPILMRVPLDRRIGEAISRGHSLVEAFPEYAPRFRELYARICRIASQAGGNRASPAS
jgi:MinD superfamily P-loop ATPase